MRGAVDKAGEMTMDTTPHAAQMRLNGLSASEVAAQMRGIWRQIETARASGAPAEKIQQLYTTYLAAADDYDMLTGQAPANLVAEHALSGGAPTSFTHEIHPDSNPAVDAAYAATMTDRFGRRTITLPITDDMLAAALMLDRLLPHELHSRLWEAMLHIESMRLTVDADPTHGDSGDGT